MQQCAEGWHLTEDPLHNDDQKDAPGEQGDNPGETGSPRRVRSTRRRSDAADLPRCPVEQRSVGRTFMAADGATYRPSMFVTLTLGSYGKVISGRAGREVRGAGSPVDPARYDYRQAAIEAMHFSRLFDRWVQNLRRCSGFVVQYFGAIEPQRRLAPHVHVALRGAIPREVLRQVTRATYLQLWWPQFDTPVHVDEVPHWDRDVQAYVDPGTGQALPTWEQALDELDAIPDADPVAVLRFGGQVDIKGIVAPSRDADRAVRYLTKYLTKAVAETYAADDIDPAYEAHIDRLHAELVFLPCSPECANWLRYDVQPRKAGPGLIPGMCPSKAHDREHLGLGGRRVQVSRHWSGKTLAEHRADRAEVVRQVLAEAGIEMPGADRMSATVLATDGKPRFVWDNLPIRSADYSVVVMGTVVEQLRWRREYRAAKEAVASRAGPRPGPVETNSATTPPRPPDNPPTLVA